MRKDRNCGHYANVVRQAKLEYDVPLQRADRDVSLPTQLRGQSNQICKDEKIGCQLDIEHHNRRFPRKPFDTSYESKKVGVQIISIGNNSCQHFRHER